MSTTKKRVRFPGIITGPAGLQSDCTVSATLVTAPGLPLVYCGFQIDNVTDTLAEGVYTVAANHMKHQVRHQGGFWVAD